MAKGFFAGSTFQGAPKPSLLPQCGACGLYKRCSTPKPGPSGAGGAGVLLVGAAPEYEDDVAGKPWQGPQGRVLRAVCSSLGVDIGADCYSTHAAACYPGRGAPTAAEVSYCRAKVQAAIKELRPHTIICLGGAATSAVLAPVWGNDVGPIQRWVGWQIPCHTTGAWVCPTWGLSDLEQKDDSIYREQFTKHLRAAFAKGGPPWPAGPPQWAQQVRRVYDPAQAAAWLDKAAQQRVGAVAWDYEATALKPEGPHAKLASCAVTWGRLEPEKTIAYPWVGPAIAATQRLLRSPIPKIASNLKFEDRWTQAEFGHRVRGWAWDTMLAAHCLDNRPGITSVKFQAYVRLGVPVWNKHVEPYLKTKGTSEVNQVFKEIALPDLLMYNGLDALLEWAVAWDQVREMGCPLPWNVG